MAKRKESDNLIVELSLNNNPNHPAKFELRVYCGNKKTNERLHGDNCHPKKDGKYPFHIHNFKTEGRDYAIPFNVSDHVKFFIKKTLELNVISSEEELTELKASLHYLAVKDAEKINLQL